MKKLLHVLNRLFELAKSKLYISIPAAILLIFAIYLLIPFPSDFMGVANVSTKIYDRNDKLLVELTPNRSGFSSEMNLSEMPTNFVSLLFFSEDRHFYEHHGVSFGDLFRAVWQNVTSLKTVSGGSTLTMQLIKMKREIKNNFFTKIFELFDAFKLEFYYSKKEILRAYLNNVYLGNRIFGIKKAAEMYFSKDVSALNLLEFAALIELIKQPSRLNPYKNIDIIEKKAKKLLIRASDSGIITLGNMQANTNDRLTLKPTAAGINAPHFCLWALEESKKIIAPGETIKEIHTTLDISLYSDFLYLINNRLNYIRMKNAGQSGILLIDNKTMEILVMIGSCDFFSADGQINATLVQRQPGSTMKPFTYALALESKKFTASTIIPDLPSSYPSMSGSYVPRNYDGRYHGPVRLAMALGCSYNIPAVYVLNKVGMHNYFPFLKKIGFDSLDKTAHHYGLGLTLGNGDVSLLELVNAYTIFPNGGFYKKARPIFYIKTDKDRIVIPQEEKPLNVLSPETAFLMNHILSEYKYKTPAFGANSPINFPFRLAVKTGTSKDYRDNTIVGYTKDLTIGVWTGNFSGAPMRDLPSSIGSGIILRDVVLELYNRGILHSEEFENVGLNIEKRRICKLSGMLAGPDCDTDEEYFLTGTAPSEICTYHRDKKIALPEVYSDWAIENIPSQLLIIDESSQYRIIKPGNGDVYRFDSSVPDSTQEIELKAIPETPDIEWSVNGINFHKGVGARFRLKPGEYRLTAKWSSGESHTVKITVVE